MDTQHTVRLAEQAEREAKARWMQSGTETHLKAWLRAGMELTEARVYHAAAQQREQP